ncbi:MAG: shikimate kinase [Conexivisphaerales archaeon]
MKGSSVTYGAISVVNAIPSGVGAAIGVSLQTRCSVQLEDGFGDYRVTINGVPVESRLALETVKLVLTDAGLDFRSFSGSIDTSTEIPMGVGLKSSSSASTAIALALCSALRIEVDFEKVLRWSCKASLNSGTSITGAMDDAAACVYGGLNVVDNRNGRVLMSREFADEYSVLIHVPSVASKRDSIDLQLMGRFGNIMSAVIKTVLAGDVWSALTLNGIVISDLMGYNNELSLEAIKAGAVCSGVSGTGPAVVAVFRDGEDNSIDELSRMWGEEEGFVIRTKVNNRRAAIINYE